MLCLRWSDINSGAVKLLLKIYWNNNIKNRCSLWLQNPSTTKQFCLKSQFLPFPKLFRFQNKKIRLFSTPITFQIFLIFKIVQNKLIPSNVNLNLSAFWRILFSSFLFWQCSLQLYSSSYRTASSLQTFWREFLWAPPPPSKIFDGVRKTGLTGPTSSPTPQMCPPTHPPTHP